MEIQQRTTMIVSREENNTLRDALDILETFAIKNEYRHYFNENLPCGYGIEDIRDGLQYVYDMVIVE
jgi:hypothetical protein